MMDRRAKCFYRFIALEYGMSIADFVNATGVSRPTLLKILKGLTHPTITTRKKLRKVLTYDQMQKMIGGYFSGSN